MPHPNFDIANSKYQISADFLGACGLNFGHRHDSASRIQMYSNHLGQRLVIEGAEERNIQTVMERKFGKHTFNIQMPCDGEILAIIPRYRPSMGENAIGYNPEELVIYQEQTPGKSKRPIGCLVVPEFISMHQYFGYRLVPGRDHHKYVRGALVKKGDVFYESTSVTNEGGYKLGVNAKTIYMTHPAVSEDGIAVRRGFLEQLRFRTYHTYVIEYGSNDFALNLYGDDKVYKPFPDIGEYIHANNVLGGTRSYRPDMLAVVEQSVDDTRQIDYFFDNLTYAAGAGGRVVDFKVQHDISANGVMIDPVMDRQVLRYDAARREHFEKIMEQYRKLERDFGEYLEITPEFQAKVYEAMTTLMEGRGPKIQKQHRKQPLDTFRVEITVEYITTPNIGFKLTDCHGGKGVICQILEDHEMPVDDEGNRADVIMDPFSSINRMNPGRNFEQFFNASSRDMHKRLCNDFLGLKPHTSASKAYNHIQKLPKEQFIKAWDYVMRFDEIISPLKRDLFSPAGEPPRVLPAFGEVDSRYNYNELSDEQKEDPIEYISQVVARGHVIFFPPDNPVESKEVVRAFLREYPSIWGPVTYIGNSGKTRRTKAKFRIADTYIIELEKTGDDWSASSSPKLTHFGVPAQITKVDRDSKPARNQATRHDGESEIRIKVAYCGELFVAEQMDRNNNPAAHRMMMDAIMRAKYPTNIDRTVDRSILGYGGSKPLQLAKHLAEVTGYRYMWKPFDPAAGQRFAEIAHEGMTADDDKD